MYKIVAQKTCHPVLSQRDKSIEYLNIRRSQLKDTKFRRRVLVLSAALMALFTVSMSAVSGATARKRALTSVQQAALTEAKAVQASHIKALAGLTGVVKESCSVDDFRKIVNVAWKAQTADLREARREFRRGNLDINGVDHFLSSAPQKSYLLLDLYNAILAQMEGTIVPSESGESTCELQANSYGQGCMSSCPYAGPDGSSAYRQCIAECNSAADTMYCICTGGVNDGAGGCYNY